MSIELDIIKFETHYKIQEWNFYIWYFFDKHWKMNFTQIEKWAFYIWNSYFEFDNLEKAKKFWEKYLKSKWCFIVKPKQ